MVALERLGAAAVLASGASMVTLSVAEKRHLMAAMVRVRTVTEAAYLHVLSQFDRSEFVVPGVSRRVGSTFLSQKMNYTAGAAAADVAAARQLDPTGAGFDLGLLAETDPTPASHQADGPVPAGSTGEGPCRADDPDGVHAAACDITGGPGGSTFGTGSDLGAAVAEEGLPRLGAALAAGLVTRAHVDVAVRCLGRVPEHLANRVDAHGVSGRTKIDIFLTKKSREHSPTSTERIAKELVAALDPDGQDRFDPLAYKRRTLSLVTDSTGMTSIRGLLDPASAAVLRAALAHYRSLTAHHLDPTTTGSSDGGDGGGVSAAAGGVGGGGGWAVPGQQSIPIRDDRSRGMRDVDALTALCEAALRAHYPSLAEGGPGCQPAAPLVKVVITATPEQAAAARRTTPGPLNEDGLPLRPPDRHDDQTPGHGDPGPPGRTGERATGPPGLAHESESGDPITAGTLGRLLCDAELQTVVLGPDRAVLDLGRSRRLATSGQRTALVARDRGCVVPGCGMPPSACEAHHVTWWRHGGTTDITNLALVCGRHHTLVHTGEWVLQMTAGVPHVVAPSWIDPSRTPRRNALFDAEIQARRLGQTIGRQQRLPYG